MMGWDLGGGLHGGLRGPDPQDLRDFRASAHWRRLGFAPERPREADLESWCPPVWDQGDLGSCVYQTYKAARELLSLKAGHALQPLSALFGYYNGRHRFWPQEADQDTGDYLRNGMRILTGRGFCLEAEWPYLVPKFRDAPPAGAYATAWSYGPRGVGAVTAYRVASLFELMDVIAAGWPVALGFPVHENFWDAAGSGRVPMPTGGVVGGHAVLAIGYALDETFEGGVRIKCRNSWGNWTHDGNLLFPGEFIAREEITTDMWAIHLKRESIA